MAEQKSSVVLKYGRRRFDGGTEIDLIRSIERRQEQNRKQRQPLMEIRTLEAPVREDESPVEPATFQAKSAPEAERTAEPAARGDEKGNGLSAWLLGPVEMTVGLAGMLTCLLAIVVSTRMDNQSLLEQSQEVFRACVKTFRKGIFDTLTTPVRVLKEAQAA